jgi:hypothetical protein
VPKQQQRRDSNAGRIVLFPARHSRAKQKAWQEKIGRSDLQETEVAGLRQYEQNAEPDDYPHRMMVNLAAFALILVLTLAGIWLAEQLALLRKHQDCAFTGRKNCGEMEVRGR